MALVNKNRQIVAQYTYDDFGHSIPVVDSIGGQPLQFAARELDAATGLYYVRARWYDPDLGRFVSEDPIGLEGGINPYAYVGNSPVNATDPSGLCIKRTGASDEDKQKVKRGEAVWCIETVALAPLTVITIGPNPFDEPRIPLPIDGHGGSHPGGDASQVSMLIGTLKDPKLLGEGCLQTRIGLRQTLNQRVERRGRTGLVRDVMWNIWAPLVYRKHFFGFFGPVQRVDYEYGKVEILTGFGAGHTLPAKGSVDCTKGVLTVTAIIPG